MKYFLLVLILFISMPALALYEEEALLDPVLEARAVALEGRLRCVVCESQTLRDSDAEVAAVMRLLIRAQIEEGMSDAEIVDWLKLRYGDDVSLMPEMEKKTFFLWFAPLGFLLVGGVLAFGVFRASKIEGEVS